MKIFRHILNRKLYTIERVTPYRSLSSGWFEATPYKHRTELYPCFKHLADKRDCQMNEFTIVGER